MSREAIARKAIVITGCSSGFGRATAIELAKLNWHVFATVRKTSDQKDLLTEARTLGCEDNITSLLCDITSAEQVESLRAQVIDALHGEQDTMEVPHLHALMNNAGTAYAGPIELISLDDLRTQFEVNVIAQVGVIQALLPMLKAAHGTIISVSSISGRISTPVTGAYNASKHALEGLSDALRVELAPFGVRVVLLEPASSPTNIWETSLKRAMAALGEHRAGPYARMFTMAEKVARRSSKVGFAPEVLARTVVKILNSDHPRARYPIPFAASVMIRARLLMPDALWDWLVRRTMRW